MSWNIFSKKKKEEKKQSVIVSMPLFTDLDGFNVEKIIDDLQNYWNLSPKTEESIEGEVISFSVDGISCFIALMNTPIPKQEFEKMYVYSYLWPNAQEEVPQHQAHAIVTLFGEASQVEKYILLTQLNASILRTCAGALGVYQGTQTLLLLKEIYLDYADFLLEDTLPIPLWVYLGIINEENQSSIYTYGMKEFGKKEIEIINSMGKKGEDLYDFLLPVLKYILGSDVDLKNGETIGFSAEQKITITESDGVYLEGKTLKLGF